MKALAINLAILASETIETTNAYRLVFLLGR